VAVTWKQTPLPNAPVSISTPESTSDPRPGAPFLTQKTGVKGMTKFTHLKPSSWYCWVATLPKGNSSTCANWTIWQFDVIDLGT
jgi:hypothetical protein